MLAGVRHSFTRAYIDTQKFVLGGSHVGKVRFTLGLFLVQKLIHWLVSRSLAQMGRPALGCEIALRNVLAGLIHRRIDAGKAHNRVAAGKTAHITDFRYELCGGGFAHTVHGPDNPYLGRCWAKRFISARKTSSVALAEASSLAVVISSFVLLSLGRVVM